MDSINILEPEIETLIASIFYLMSRYADINDPEIADAIDMHLKLLETHPKLTSPVLMKTCKRLQCHWVNLGQNKPCDYFKYDSQDKRIIH